MLEFFDKFLHDSGTFGDTVALVIMIAFMVWLLYVAIKY